MTDYAAVAQEGAQAGNMLATANRKAMAYNALVNAYGPQAADPEAWGQATEAATKAALLPGAVPAQAAHTGYENAATSNLTAEAATTNAKLPGVVPAQAAETDFRNAQTSGALQDQARNAAAFHAQQLNAALAPDASNAESLWNARAPVIAQDLGVKPDDPSFAQSKQAYLADPRGFLARAMNLAPKQGIGIVNGQPTFTTENPLTATPLPANTPATPFLKTAGAPQNYIDGSGKNHTVTFDEAGNARENGKDIGAVPADWKPLRQEAINVQNYGAQTRREGVTGEGPVPGAPGVPAGSSAPVPGSGDQKAIPPTSRYARLVTQKDKDTANDTAAQAVTVADGVAQAKPILQQTLTQLSPYSTGPGTLLKDLPGSVQNNLRRNLETLKANEFLSVLGGMKNSKGQSGAGRILQSEVPMMQAAYGNMSQDQTVGQLAQHISLLSQLLDRSSDKMLNGFKAAYGADPYDVRGVAPYSPKMTTPATGAAAAPAGPQTRPITSGPHKGGTAVSNDGGKTWELQ